MKLAQDFREIARDALKGKWALAVGVGLVASLLGAHGGETPEINVNIDSSNANLNLNYAGQTIFSTGENIHPNMGAWIAGGLGIILVAAIIIGLIYFVLGSIVGVGYSKFNLNLVDGKSGAFENLFEYFSFWKTTTLSKLLRALYTFLWTLLFIIPGIIASFSYSMTDYILAENTDISASEAINKSKEIMEGNRWRFFCLQFSFIGWDILAAFTFGIGYLWLTPYKQAAYAAFYREISAEYVGFCEQVSE